MRQTCMTCGNNILAADLGAKICIAVIEKERDPFFVPIVLSEPVHANKYLCGQCAKERGMCPFCNGALAPREEIASAISLNSIGEEAFNSEFRKRRNIDGKFRCIFLIGKDLYFSYTVNGISRESFWKEI